MIDELAAARELIRCLEMERDHFLAGLKAIARMPHAPRYEVHCPVCVAQMFLKGQNIEW